MAKRGDPDIARVQARVGTMLREQRVVRAVVGADEFAVAAVVARAAEMRDPAVLVGRHGLRGELAADPGELFGHDDGAAGLGDRERGGDAADSASDHGDITREGGDHAQAV